MLVLIIFIYFLFKKSGCEVKFVTQNGLEEMVFEGVLEKVSYTEKDVDISISGSKCVKNGLKIKNSKFPLIVMVNMREGVNLHKINTIYQFADLKDIFTKWHGKKVEVFVYNKTVNFDSFTSDKIDSLDNYQKENWLVYGILRNKFLSESVLGKFLVKIGDIYPVVEMKIYD